MCGMHSRHLLLIIVLFLGFSIPTRSVDATEITVPGDYPTIQAAINSDSGDTILVSAGVHEGKIVIDRPLHLVGVSRENTFIDGQGCTTLTCESPVVLVSSSNVEIRGFTILNPDVYGAAVSARGVSNVNVTGNVITSTMEEGDGVRLTEVSGCVVSDNVFRVNLFAVNITDSSFNLIVRNIVEGSNVAGIELFGGKNNTVAGNTVMAEENGVELVRSANNTVSGNVLKRGSIHGIMLEGSSKNTVVENNFLQNRIGINVQFSRENIFYLNNFVSSVFRQVSHVDEADLPFNRWDNGTAGNYWDDYAGLDDGSNQRTNGDGIGDTGVPHRSVDNYPLMAPFVPVALLVRAVTASPTTGRAPLAVSFSADVVGGLKPYSYSWTLGDGNSASQQGFSHTYSSAGSYNVRVRVSDAAGSLDENFVTVSVGLGGEERPNLWLWWVAGGVGVAGTLIGLGVFLARRTRHECRPGLKPVR